MANTKEKKIDLRDEIEREAISIVDNEVNAWKDSVVFVTERVAFDMRNLIRDVRKNYWGIFDNPIDPITGREKIWIPLTESTVDAVVKSIDLDTKDVNFTSNKPNSSIGVSILRSVARHFLRNFCFGEKLDQLEKDGSIDGVAVWKTWKEKVNGEVKMIVKKVDTLNCYLDPTSDNIQDAYRFTERALLTPTEISKMDGWINTKDIAGVVGLHPSESDLRGTDRASVRSSVKMVDVYEMWGMIPKYLITGKKEDKETEIKGRIIMSGIESGDKRVHLVEERDDEFKPYEEFQMDKVSGRWIGRGIGEKLLFLQLWLNTVKNTHINRSYVSQLGLFKVKQGSGLNTEIFSNLSTNGAIMVKNMEDIQQMVVQDASASAYRDEAGIIDWSQRVTSAFEVITGEKLPADTTATAATIQTRNAQSKFVLVKEQLGMFLDRWLMRHCLPIMIETLKEDELVSIIGSADELKEFDKELVETATNKFAIERTEETGFTPTEEELDFVREGLNKKIQKLGKERFVRIKKGLLKLIDYNLDIMITNEKQDVGVLAKNLISAIQVAPEFRTQITKKLFEILGLDFRESEKDEITPEIAQMMGRARLGTQSPERSVMKANQPI